MHNVGTLLTDIGLERAAIAVYDQDLQLAEASLGRRHPAIADRLVQIAGDPALISVSLQPCLPHVSLPLSVLIFNILPYLQSCYGV